MSDYSEPYMNNPIAAGKTSTHLFSLTWTPKVCRIMAFMGFWTIILLTFGGLGIV